LDPETAAKRFEDLKKELDAAYAHMSGAVLGLPVPVRLPPWQDNQPAVVRSLDLAWDLAPDAADPQDVDRVRGMLTAWVTAYEVAQVAAVSGPAPWRLRAIAAALATCRELARQVIAHRNELAALRQRIAAREASLRKEGS
jgi:hypothetical protein